MPADMRDHRPRFLPAAFSDLQVKSRQCELSKVSEQLSRHRREPWFE
jgi:hypothetical protein